MIPTSLAQSPTPPLTDPSVGRGRRLLWPAVSAAGATGFVLVAHLLDPNQPGNYPTCPWLLLTGTFCPGCGTLRATHALSNGDVLEALHRNPLAVATFVVMVLGFARWTRRQWRGERRMTAAPAWLLYGLFWVIMAFWVLRNVPGWTWLSPN
ncbi:DUF2752 domain-containing protein [Knoellia sp. CPCC 206450]|uniref:DUF2752 domain-containing protein n=1 Tax=Knoellia tibetensis TaxID=3404798 RepID=UPI003B43B031